MEKAVQAPKRRTQRKKATSADRLKEIERQIAELELQKKLIDLDIKKLQLESEFLQNN